MMLARLDPGVMGKWGPRDRVFLEIWGPWDPTFPGAWGPLCENRDPH